MTNIISLQLSTFSTALVLRTTSYVGLALRTPHLRQHHVVFQIAHAYAAVSSSPDKPNTTSCHHIAIILISNLGGSEVDGPPTPPRIRKQDHHATTRQEITSQLGLFTEAKGKKNLASHRFQIVDSASAWYETDWTIIVKINLIYY